MKNNKIAILESFIDKHKAVILLMTLAILIGVPFYGLSRLVTRIIIMILLYAILGLGLNVLLGFIGQVSLGHAGFFAIGAYITAVLTVKFGFSWWIASVCALVGTGLIGFLLFLPTFRVSGSYLTIVTLGFGYIVTMVLQRWESVTNGNYGIRNIPAPTFFGIKLTLTNGGYYWLALAMLLIVLLFCHLLKNSATGRAMTAVREDELAAKMMGINTQKYKMEAFVISAAITGIGGSFYAFVNNGFIEPTNFSFEVSTALLECVIIGGMGTLRGPLLGAVIIQVLPQVFRFLEQWRFMVFGILLVLILRYRPQGLLGWNTTLPFKIPEKAKQIVAENAEGKEEQI